MQIGWYRFIRNVLLAVAFLTMGDAVAWAQTPGSGGTQLSPLLNIVNVIVEFLTGAFARSCAIIAVAAFGYAGLAGRMNGRLAGQMIAGIAFIFGGATMIDALIPAVGR